MNISTFNNREDELKTVELLREIISNYSVPEFTEEILVRDGAIPHSHPILTLNTRQSDKLGLLQTLVHEQFHWYVQTRPKYKECVAHLKDIYQDDGEHNKSGNYPNSYWEHIIVCFNTRFYLQKIISDTELKEIYSQWQPYPTLEKYVEENFYKIEKDLLFFGMVYKNI